MVVGHRRILYKSWHQKFRSKVKKYTTMMLQRKEDNPKWQFRVHIQMQKSLLGDFVSEKESRRCKTIPWTSRTPKLAWVANGWWNKSRRKIAGSLHKQHENTLSSVKTDIKIENRVKAVNLESLSKLEDLERATRRDYQTGACYWNDERLEQT